eukprot:4093695-Lingulodinium_polyedra.AAC.1
MLGVLGALEPLRASEASGTRGALERSARSAQTQGARPTAKLLEALARRSKSLKSSKHFQILGGR